MAREVGGVRVDVGGGEMGVGEVGEVGEVGVVSAMNRRPEPR